MMMIIHTLNLTPDIRFRPITGENYVVLCKTLFQKIKKPLRPLEEPVGGRPLEFLLLGTTAAAAAAPP